MKERKIYRLLEEATMKKKKRKVPPPLAPLPYHLIPKKLLNDLNISAPLAIGQNGMEVRGDGLTQKQKEELIARGINQV